MYACFSLHDLRYSQRFRGSGSGAGGAPAGARRERDGAAPAARPMASISVLKNTDAFAAAVAASPAIYIVAPAASLRDGSAFRLLPDLGGTALLETAAAMAESASSSADVSP